MKLAIVSDEISQDFESAVVLGKKWGIENLEIRSIYLHRVPDISEREKGIILGTIERYGINVTSISPGLFKIPLDSERLEEHLEEKFQRSVNLARELGTDKMVVFGFVKPQGAKGEDYPQQVVDLLGSASEKAYKEGVTLLLENEPVCWAGTGKVTAQIVSKVGSRNLRVNWDPCNAFSSGEDRPYPDGYQHVKRYMSHLHIKDAKRTEEGGHTYVAIGEGEVDWAGQLKALRDDGYDGYYMIETHFGPGVVASKACLDGLRRVIEEAW